MSARIGLKLLRIRNIKKEMGRGRTRIERIFLEISENPPNPRQSVS